MNTYELLAKINVNEHTEKKNGLTYLSWAWAWDQIKRIFPDSFYTIYENRDGLFYHTDGKTCWVKTGVTLVDADGKQNEAIEYLPVMDYKNRSIPVEAVTSFDVNKAIQRSLTKAVARHGLGLYIYAGEDLPEDDKGETPVLTPVAKATVEKHTEPTNVVKMDAIPASSTDRMNVLAEFAKVNKLTNKQMREARAGLVECGTVSSKSPVDMTDEEFITYMSELSRVFA